MAGICGRILCRLEQRENDVSLSSIRNLVIIVQIVSLGASALSLFFGLNLGLDPETARAYGGNLTLLLLVLVIISHFKLRKGEVPAGILALVGVFGPAYAILNGNPRHLIGFHVVVGLFHLFALFLYHKHLREHPPRETSG